MDDKATGAIGIASMVHRIGIRPTEIVTLALPVLVTTGAADMRGDRRVVAIAVSSPKVRRGGIGVAQVVLAVPVTVGRRWKALVRPAPNIVTGDLIAPVVRASPTDVLMGRAMRMVNVVLAAGGTVNGGETGQALVTKLAVQGPEMAKKAAGACVATGNVGKVRHQERKVAGVRVQMVQVAAVKVHVVLAEEPISRARPDLLMGATPKRWLR